MDMIKNAVCTVVRADEDASTLIYRGKCTWQEVKGREVKKYGEERADSAAVWIYDLSADIREGDMIIRGETDDLNAAVHDGMTVVSVSVKEYCSPELRHIRLGVR